MIIRTARYAYAGVDRLDITRKGNHPVGSAFAPSERILSPALAERRRADRILSDAEARAKAEPAIASYVRQHASEEAEAIRAASWKRYESSFRIEMRASFRDRKRDWDAVLAMPEVTLVCFCTDRARCHASIVAALLAAAARARGMAVEERGERAAAAPAQRSLF